MQRDSEVTVRAIELGGAAARAGRLPLAIAVRSREVVLDERQRSLAPVLLEPIGRVLRTGARGLPPECDVERPSGWDRRLQPLDCLGSTGGQARGEVGGGRVERLPVVDRQFSDLVSSLPIDRTKLRWRAAKGLAEILSARDRGLPAVLRRRSNALGRYQHIVDEGGPGLAALRRPLRGPQRRVEPRLARI